MSRKRSKHKFKFTIHVRDLRLPQSHSSRLAVSCSRGTTMVTTEYVNAVDGQVTWNADLQLETPMYYEIKSKAYAKKTCRVHVKQMKSRPDSRGCLPKNVAFTEIDLSKFTNVSQPLPLELKLSACSVPNAVLNVTLSSVQLSSDEPTPPTGDDDLASLVFSDTGSGTSFHFSDLSSLALGPDFDDFAEEFRTPAELTAKNLAQFSECLVETPERQPSFPQTPEQLLRTRVIPRRFSSPASGASVQRQQSWSTGAEAQVFALRIEALTKDVEFLRAENEFLRHKADSNVSDDFFQGRQNLALAEELEQARGQTKLLEEQLALEKQAHTDTQKSFQIELQSARNQVETHTENQLEDQLKSERVQQRRELELHRRIADLESNFDDLARSHRTLRRTHDETKSWLSSTRKETAQIRDHLYETTKKYKGCLVTLKASKSSLRKRVASQQSQIDDLEATLLMVRNSWNDTAQLMEKQISGLQDELNHTKVKLSMAEDNNRQMEAEVTPIRNHAHRLQLRRERTEDKLLRNEMTLAKQTVELTTLRTQLLSARGDNDHLKRTLSRLSVQKNVSDTDVMADTSNVGSPSPKRGRGTTVVSMDPRIKVNPIDVSPKSLSYLCRTSGSFTSRSSSSSSVSRLEAGDIHSGRASFSSTVSGGTSRSGSVTSAALSSCTETSAGVGVSIAKQKVLRAAAGRDLLSTYSTSSSSVDKSDASVRGLRERLDHESTFEDRLSDLSGDEAEDMEDVD